MSEYADSSGQMLIIADYEQYAKGVLDSQSWIFFSQGSEREVTLKDNIKSFTRYTLIPRLLRNTLVRDLSVTVLGERLSIPICLAPTAYQRLAHPDGEIAASRAAAEAGTIYTLSTVANTSLEDVAESRPHGPLWMQIYMMTERKYTEDMVKRAEAVGYKALVLTVDTPVTGLQFRNWRQGLTMPPNISVPNISRVLKEIRENQDHRNLVKNPSLLLTTITWEDVTWVKSISNLPIVLKGILTAEDALLAVKYGAAAVWVSNHGGRQLDGVDATLDALPAISAALEGTGCEVYVDGGIRWGSDVMKALALGARAVFIGRPLIWGLAHSGQEGVRHVLEILRAELDRAMHLAGCETIADIGPSLIKRNNRCSCNF